MLKPVSNQEAVEAADDILAMLRPTLIEAFTQNPTKGCELVLRLAPMGWEADLAITQHKKLRRPKVCQ